jgi:hypothetical protein
MNGPSKRESYITLGWKGFPGTKTLAYSAYLISYKENSDKNTLEGFARGKTR